MSEQQPNHAVQPTACATGLQVAATRALAPAGG
jgi:hypothetical protein